jgi:hypothetical protein
MKIFSILLGCNFLVFFGSCERKADLTETEVYTILNQIIQDDSLRLGPLCSKFQILEAKGENSIGFSGDEMSFVNRQNVLFSGLTIKPNILKKRNWKNFKTGQSPYIVIDSLCSKGIVTILSFPFISPNRQKVLIEITQECNCMLGGQGGKYLYVKIKGHWKRKKSFDTWIS